MSQQRAECEPESRQDADRFGKGLNNDSKLHGVKILAGVLSIVTLVAMFITALFRVPNPAWPVVLAILAVGLSLAMSVRLVRRRANRRRPGN